MVDPFRIAREAALVALGVALAGCGLAIALISGTYPAHAAGLAAAAVGLVVLAREGRAIAGRVDPGSRAGRVAAAARPCVPAALVVMATCSVYWYLTAGQMPWNGDHPVHLFKAWQLGERLLPSGRLTGWSHFWWAGYPAEVEYPFLGDLLVVAVRSASLGMMPWHVAYAYALLVTMVLYHLGVYVLGRRWFGPWAGAAGAIVTLLDRGGPREGGWYWTMANGVWPMALGTALWLLAFERFLAVLERPTRRRVAALAVLEALALLGHPMTLTFTLALFPAAWALHSIRAEKGRVALPSWAAVSGLALAGILAAFWYIPFLGFKDLVEKVGDVWWTLPEIGDRITDLSIFEATWRLPVALGVGGAILAWVRGHRAGRDVTVMAAFLMIAISSTTLVEIPPRWIGDALEAIHFRRFTYPLKAMWFLLAGYAIAGMAGIGSAAAPGGDAGALASPGGWRRWARIAIAALVMIPILEGSIMGLYYRQIRDIGQSWPLEEAVHYGAYRDSNEWFRKHVKPGGPFFRIAYEVGGSGHLFYSAPIYTGRPAVVLSQYTAATTFKRQFSNNGPVTFDLQHVKYAVALNDIFAKRDDLVEVHRSGIMRIYEVTTYRPEPFDVEGDAKVKLLEFGDERIRLDVRSPSPGDRLVLHVTSLDRWKATLGGKPVRIETVEASPQVKWLMRVPLARPGVLEFRYTRAPSEIRGWALSAAGALAVLLLLAWGWIAARMPAVGRATRRASRIAGRAAAPALAALALAGLAGAVAIVGVKAGGEGAIAWRLPDHVHEAKIRASGSEGGFTCERTFDKRIVCAGGQELFIYKGGRRSGGRHSSKAITGLLVRPFLKLHLLLDFPRVKMGASLALRCGTDYLDHGKNSVEVKVSTGKMPMGSVTCPADGNFRDVTLDTRAWKGKMIPLLFDVANSTSPSPLLVLDAWIPG